MKGKLIVIDGIDGVGKATQTELLVQRLKKEGCRVKRIDFPRYYDNFFGEFIGECLRGDYGNFLDVPPRIASVLYAADRWESSKQIQRWLSQGFVVVSDRYVSSNQIHQGGKITDPKERTAFLEWLDRMEHDVFEIPRPDVIIYLNLPTKLSQELLAKATSDKESLKKRYLKGRKDLAETNIEHLEESKENALKIVKKNNTWKKINCARGEKVMPPEVIHEKVYKEACKIIQKQ